MEDYEDTGIVGKPSDDHCTLSAIIGGYSYELKFSRGVFYTHRFNCEGSLKNILEEGDDVEFCYKLSSGKPEIIAVWLGERPDLPSSDESQLEMNEQSGVVGKLSDDSGTLSATIRGNSEMLHFPRRVFYAFGFQCEGSLKNILEEGDEVDFCYKLKSLKPEVIAVWIGEKPPQRDMMTNYGDNDERKIAELVSLTSKVSVNESVHSSVPERFPEVLFNDPPLQGTRLELLSPNIGMISYGSSDLQVFVRQCNFYINKRRCSNDQFKASFTSRKTAVNFEGVRNFLPRRGDLQGIECPYEATCAWIGEKPSLRIVVSRMPRPITKFLFKRENVTFYGSVTSFYLPDIAILTITGLNCTACLPASSFLSDDSNDSKLITDFVRLDQCLSMKLAEDLQCEIPVRASDIKIINKMEMLKRTRYDKARYPDLYVARQKANLRPISDIKQVLFANPPLTGSIIWGSSNKELIISYQGMNIELEDFNLFHHGHACYMKRLLKLVKKSEKPVNFEAIYGVNREKGSLYYATLSWVGRKPTLFDVAKSIQGPPTMAMPFADRTFFGYVIRLYFPHDALLRIKIRDKPTVVCLHVSAFQRSEMNCRQPVVDSKRSIITNFVHYKEYLTFKVRRNPKCSVGLCAYDVKKSNEESYNAFCAVSKEWAK